VQLRLDREPASGQRSRATGSSCTSLPGATVGPDVLHVELGCKRNDVHLCNCIGYTSHLAYRIGRLQRAQIAMCGRARCTLAREQVAEAAGVAPEEFVDGDKCGENAQLCVAGLIEFGFKSDELTLVARFQINRWRTWDRGVMDLSCCNAAA